MMSIQLLQRFSTQALRLYDACLVIGQPDRLALLYADSSQALPERFRLVSFALVNLHQRKCDYVLSYSGSGPGEWGLPWEGRLCHDAVHKRRVIAQVQSPFYVAPRTLTVEDDGKPRLSPLCLLDKTEEIERGIGPLLDVQIDPDAYRLLYHRPTIEHLGAPELPTGPRRGVAHLVDGVRCHLDNAHLDLCARSGDTGGCKYPCS